MNTDTHRNGCHNRKPYRVSMPVQDGYFMDGVTRISKMISAPFRLSTGCEYSKSSLGADDKGCTGCQWKQIIVNKGKSC